MTLDAREIAAQLRCPQGAEGEITARRMNEANARANRQALAGLSPQAGERLLEIGPGNGAFVAEVLSAAPALDYCGLDWSEDMVHQAARSNAEAVAAGQASFVRGRAEALPWGDGHFDGVWSVHGLYFWRPAVTVLTEVRRVLRPGGRLCLVWGDRDFMAGLPFTAHGFALYDRAEGEALLRAAGFRNLQHDGWWEESPGQTGQILRKQLHRVLARAPF